jgi:hypothetical protein
LTIEFTRTQQRINPYPQRNLRLILVHACSTQPCLN